MGGATQGRSQKNHTFWWPRLARIPRTLWIDRRFKMHPSFFSEPVPEQVSQNKWASWGFQLLREMTITRGVRQQKLHMGRSKLHSKKTKKKSPKRLEFSKKTTVKKVELRRTFRRWLFLLMLHTVWILALLFRPFFLCVMNCLETHKDVVSSLWLPHTAENQKDPENQKINHTRTVLQ